MSEERGPLEAEVLREVGRKLRLVTSGVDEGWGSAREYSIEVLGKSNSVVSNAIKYPQSISDAMLARLGERDPKNFPHIYERVLLARIRDGAPELLENSQHIPREKADKLLELVRLLRDASDEILRQAEAGANAESTKN